MKKVKTMVMMAMVALMAVTTFSSCRDESIASTLDGVWRGNMYSTYGGYVSTESEIEFISNGAFSRSGRGYWVDYYDHYWRGRNYICNEIEWTVDDGNIHVRFINEGTKIVIYHYTLNDRYFDGVLDDGGNSVSFRLNRISSPRNGSWDRYDYYDYDYYGYTYNQAKGSRSANDSIEVPKRGIAFPNKK